MSSNSITKTIETPNSCITIDVQIHESQATSNLVRILKKINNRKVWKLGYQASPFIDIESDNNVQEVQKDNIINDDDDGNNDDDVKVVYYIDTPNKSKSRSRSRPRIMSKIEDSAALKEDKGDTAAVKTPRKKSRAHGSTGTPQPNINIKNQKLMSLPIQKLKAMCSANGIPCMGTKLQLITRLRMATQNKQLKT